MNNIFLLFPLYNDWISLNILLNKIKKLKLSKIKILIVNDNSDNKNVINYKKDNFFKSIKIINLKKNFGHDRAIVAGLYYLIKKNIIFDCIITMDSDGEDDPKYLSNIIQLHKRNPDKIILCKRQGRNEGIIFKSFYYIHLLIIFFFTFRWLNFGAYNCLPREKIYQLLNSKTIWGNYSASIAKLNLNNIYLNTNRANRYFYPSKTSFKKLVLHSLSIMSVFKKEFILFYFFYSLSFIFVVNKLNISAFILIFIFIIISIIFFLLNFRENKKWKKIIFKNISF
jgi:hypothetical protein